MKTVDTSYWTVKMLIFSTFQSKIYKIVTCWSKMDFRAKKENVNVILDERMKFDFIDLVLMHS